MTDTPPPKKLDLSSVSLAGDGEPDAEADAATDEAEAPARETRDPETLASIVESLLFATGEPLTAAQLSRSIGSTSAADVRKAVAALRAQYEETDRAFEIVDIAGGLQLLTRQEFAPFVRKLKKQRDMARLSPAAIETLAIIAYNPSITRAEIENIRGVGCGPILRGLIERKLIRTAGRSDKLGSPLMYEITKEFLEHFGLGSLKDMPRLSEFTPLKAAPAEEAEEDGEANAPENDSETESQEESEVEPQGETEDVSESE